LKQQIKRTQIKAAVTINSQLIMLYWDLGRQIVEKQEKAKWGSGFIERLSQDLRSEFPEMTGFSRDNLLRAKRFYLFYKPLINYNEFMAQVVPQIEEKNLDKMVAQAVRQTDKRGDDQIVAQAVPQLEEHKVNREIINVFILPWGHHILIMQKTKNVHEAVFYINKTIENNWSRAVLEYQIETNLYKRQGKAATNFKLTLPEIESDLANEILKSEYNFEFLQLSDKVKAALPTIEELREELLRFDA